MTCYFHISNEVLIIIENLNALDIPLPNFITNVLRKIKDENEAEKLYALGMAFFSVITIALGPVGIAVTTFAAAEAVLALTNDDIEEILLDCKSTIHSIEKYLYENKDIEDVGVNVTFKGVKDSNTGEIYFYPYSCYMVGGR